MMRNKKILNMLLQISPFVVAGTLVTVGFTLGKNTTSQKYDYNNLITKNLNDEVSDKNEFKKVIKRTKNFVIPQNDNFKQIEQEINNTFELKLLLNYPVEEKNTINEDVDFFTKENNKTKDELFKKFSYIKSGEISKLSPVIWLFFNTNEEKQKFINEIEKDENFFQIIDLEYTTSANSNSLFSEIKNKDPYEEDWDNYPIKITKNNLNVINFDKIHINSKHPRSQIGIMEVFHTVEIEKNNYKIINNGILDKNISKNIFKDFQIYNNDGTPSSHAGVVAGIAAGRDGVDTEAKVYSAGFINDSMWQKQIEWMVIDNGVRVINHSYGAGKHEGNEEYGEQAYFIDYISRKYGVVNVFAAGNGHNKDPKEYNKYIDRDNLSFNSIVVGALQKDSTKNNYKIANYSNRTLENKYNELPKPLVVAPGYFEYKNRNNQDIKDQGTSYAAPLVTGAISVLLKEKSWLNDDWKRVPAIKAILAASSILNPKDKDLNINSNGLSKTYGSGLIDYERMLKAYIPVEVVHFDKNQKEYIMKDDNLFLNNGDKIKIASSWMFNAGILKNEKTKPAFWERSFWWWLNPFNWGKKANNQDEIDNWNKNYNKSDWLKKEKTFQKQNSRFFSDFDLYLEKWNGHSWETVKSVLSINSNVEVIEYTSDEKAKYRIKVKRYTSPYEEFVDDIMAVTYVKN
ncbi:S8 family serine peptidase [Mesomycoplasma neurolyticum]|uniref:Subtilase family n=1 Tax=Mesomycoplasma neurolyticum TaxID=2120 RepID=A0A449A508_9BACT|nr:S8 family serine peptidase [Mesomycoplasma neurolyticum]VEU59294.1 Subtilase family [Mesomycoplasma neurolyticum]